MKVDRDHEASLPAVEIPGDLYPTEDDKCVSVKLKSFYIYLSFTFQEYLWFLSQTRPSLR